jgi:8-oxo-dGTP pyrophosphatase MutT (NUDIX family)
VGLGGKLKAGESPEMAAIRETLEETGFRCGHAGKWHCRRVKDDGAGVVDATTYLFDCDEIVPRLNREHDLWAWVNPDEALEESGAS